MESTTLLSLSCVVCFVIYYELAGASYIDHLSNGSAVVSQILCYPTDTDMMTPPFISFPSFLSVVVVQLGEGRWV